MGGGAACRELARNGGSRLSETHRRSDGGAGPLREDLASVTRRPSPVADCSSVTRAVTLGGPPFLKSGFMDLLVSVYKTLLMVSGRGGK